MDRAPFGARGLPLRDGPSMPRAEMTITAAGRCRVHVLGAVAAGFSFNAGVEGELAQAQGEQTAPGLQHFTTLLELIDP